MMDWKYSRVRIVYKKLNNFYVFSKEKLTKHQATTTSNSPHKSGRVTRTPIRCITVKGSRNSLQNVTLPGYEKIWSKKGGHEI